MTKQLSVQGFPVRTIGASYLPRSIEALQGLLKWRQSDPDAPDLWLRTEIGTGFQQLVMLRLAGTPAVEMLPLTAEMWVSLVGEGMNESQDRERVKAGFKQLCRTLKWWPQPTDLFKAMPNRPSAPLRDPARAERSRSQEADVNVSDGVAKFQNIMDMLDELQRKETLERTEACNEA